MPSESSKDYAHRIRGAPRSPIEVLNALQERKRRVISRVWYAWQFGEFGLGSTIGKPELLTHLNRIEIGRNAHIRSGARLEIVIRDGEPLPRLVVGDGVTIEQNVHIVCSGLITIGCRTAIAPNCVLVDSAHPLGSAHPPGKSRSGPIEAGETWLHVGCDVLVGAGAVILPRTTIGDGATIGANAVVTRDVSKFATVAGVPARSTRS